MGRSGKSKRAGALGKSVKAGKSSKAKPRTEPKVTVPAAVAGALRRMFDKTGYVREPSPYKRRKFGEAYKKGYEVRLVVATRAELRTLRSLLKRAGFPVRRAFEKHSKLVQPVYGYDAFKWFTQSR